MPYGRAMQGIERLLEGAALCRTRARASKDRLAKRHYEQLARKWTETAQMLMQAEGTELRVSGAQNRALPL
jgi:hypothetical protein